MKLRDLEFPVSIDTARQYALVFSSALAQRLAELHRMHGSQNCVPIPRSLSNGRLMLYADVLTEVSPGGLLHEMWEAADKDVLRDSVDVIPVEEALAMIADEEQE